VVDGNINATVSGGTLGGVIGGDSVSLAAAIGTFDTRNAGTGKMVTVSDITLSGGDAGNYKLGTTTVTTADIAKAPLIITAAANTKIYDGNMTALAAPTVTSGVLMSGDKITGLAESYSDKNAGSGKTLNVNNSYTITDGNGGNNYAVTFASVNTGVINQAKLTVSASGNNKVYDRTTSATASYGDNRISGDVLAVTGSASFGDKNVGLAKPVSITGISLSGSDAGNYVLASTSATTSADITPAPLTLNGVTASNKVYDGNTNATISGGTLGGVISGDTVSVAASSGSFDTRNVGVGKQISVAGIALSGADAVNYTLGSATATTKADITPASLTIIAVTNTKSYDGGTSASAIPTVSGLMGGDTASASEAYLDKNAGTGKALSVNGYTVNDGNSGGNYTITKVNDNTGVITPAALTVAADDKTKGFGDANPALTASYSGFKSNDTPDVVSGLTLSTTADQNSVAGYYPIIAANGTAVNYTLIYQDGIMTITPSSSSSVSSSLPLIVQDLTNDMVVAFHSANGTTTLLSGTGDNSIFTASNGDSNSDNNGMSNQVNGATNENNPAISISHKRNYCN
jgi:hypothetical protein